MRKLYWDESFRRAFKRRTRNDPSLQSRIFDTLARLTTDPFHPQLRTHKLKRQLEGLWACFDADFNRTERGRRTPDQVTVLERGYSLAMF